MTTVLNYATVASLRGLKVNGVIIDLDTYIDEELEELLGIAEFIVEKYTGTIFYAIADTTYYFNGTGNQLLYFYPSINYPIISASTCTEVDPEGNILLTFIQGTEYTVKPWYLAWTWQQTTFRQRVSKCGLWPAGWRNIAVTGDWGLEEVPLVIKRATLLLAGESAKRGSTGLLNNNTFRQRWDDYEVEYKGKSAEKALPAETTGFEYIDRLLDSFRWRPDLFLTPETQIPADFPGHALGMRTVS